jgi:DNA-binding NarL/FixJ family response regulator
MIDVLVADDQQLVRAGVRMLLDAAEGIQVVAEASDGRQAIALAGQHRPEVTLMDIRMPRVDGIEAARRILAERPGAKIVILTTFAQDENVYAALSAGAIGFLVKDDDPQHMLDAIRRAAGGEPLLAPSVLRRVVQQAMDSHAEQHANRQVPPSLTPRERDVLALTGAGLSNQEIATRLHVGVTTVKTHISSVMDKCEMRNRTQVAVLAHRLGLVHEDFTPKLSS